MVEGRIIDMGIAQADDPIYQQGWIIGGWISKGKTFKPRQTQSVQNGK